MSPLRKQQIGAHLIEEYYWSGELVVYVDHQLCPLSYQDACKVALQASLTKDGAPSTPQN